jgi:hypothetical protein
MYLERTMAYMYAERQGRYPKGTYKVLFARQSGNTEYCMVNLTTSRQTRSHTVWDLIKNIETDLSDNKYPQSSIQYRSWGSAAPVDSKPEQGNVISIDSVKATAPQEVYSPTFIVKVLYRQNATWQGTIQWIEGKQTRQYRSVNELLKLMDEAADLSQGEAKTE